MSFGSIMSQLRKENGLSRDELAKMIGTSGAIIGRYERDDMKPSIEIAVKIANALNISLDYLVGNSNLIFKDKKVIQRIEDILEMPEQDRNQVFSLIDALIRDYKAKQAYKS